MNGKKEGEVESYFCKGVLGACGGRMSAGKVFCGAVLGKLGKESIQLNK